MKIILIVLVTALSSCSIVEKKIKARKEKKITMIPLSNEEGYFSLRDDFGTYKTKRNIEIKKNKKLIITRQKTTEEDKSFKNPLENLVSVSEMGILKMRGKRIPLLRPKFAKSHFTLEGKKYTSTMKINIPNKSFDVYISGVSNKKAYKKVVQFPGNKGAYCFFTQLVECIRYTGFFERARKYKSGKMSLVVIWDGFPFISAQMKNLPQKLFSEAVFSYEEDGKKGDSKFFLSVENQYIFYTLNKSLRLKNLSWVSQGITFTRSI